MPHQKNHEDGINNAKEGEIDVLRKFKEVYLSYSIERTTEAYYWFCELMYLIDVILHLYNMYIFIVF